MTIINKNSIAKSEKYWLNDATNLVTSLSKYYGKITLDKISQKFDNLNSLESKLLDIDNALVRQITLSNSNEILVFARTIIPKDTYDFFTQELDNLGTKPIGDNLLFDKSKFDRGEFTICKFSADEFYNETGRTIDKYIVNPDTLCKNKTCHSGLDPESPIRNPEILNQVQDDGIVTQYSSIDYIYSRSSVFEYKNDKRLKFLITEYFLILPEYCNA